jgi:hypothetical protein
MNLINNIIEFPVPMQLGTGQHIPENRNSNRLEK